MSSKNIIFIVLILAVFYMLFIVPQRRNQKNRQNMMKQLGPGAKVLTSGGLYGHVVAINGDVLVVRVADGVDIEFDQRAIIRVVEGAPEHSSYLTGGVDDESEAYDDDEAYDEDDAVSEDEEFEQADAEETADTEADHDTADRNARHSAE